MSAADVIALCLGVGFLCMLAVAGLMYYAITMQIAGLQTALGDPSVYSMGENTERYFRNQLIKLSTWAFYLAIAAVVCVCIIGATLLWSMSTYVNQPMTVFELRYAGTLYLVILLPMLIYFCVQIRKQQLIMGEILK